MWSDRAAILATTSSLPTPARGSARTSYHAWVIANTGIMEPAAKLAPAGSRMPPRTISIGRRPSLLSHAAN